MRRLFSIGCLTAVASLVAIDGYCQLSAFPFWDWWTKIGNQNRYTERRNDYRIVWSNAATGADVDSLLGHSAYKGILSYDSNNAHLSVRGPRYYCRLEHRQKKASLYNIATLANKLHLKLSSQPMYIPLMPDSVIAKYGKLDVDSSQADMLRLRLTIAHSPMSITLSIRRRDFVVQYISVELEETVDEEVRLKKKIQLFNFSNTVPDYLFNTQRFYRSEQKQVWLNPPYNHYRLTNILL